MIWALIPGPVKRALAWFLAGLAAVAGVWGLAKRDARQKAALDAAKEYRKTRERIDHVETPSDPDAARRWLRERGER